MGLKNSIIKIFCILLIFALCSCTKNFRNINTDKSGITDEDMAIDFNNLGILIGVIQQGIYFNYDFGKGKNWPYQIMQNLNADMFSGYMHDYKPHNGGSSNSDYNLQDGWNGSNWGYTYAYVFPQIKKLEDSTILKYPSVYAIAKVMKVEAMHRISDIYGSLVYTSYGRNHIAAESQKEAYYAFFEDLDTAVTFITTELSAGKTLPDLSKVDILLGGDYRAWIKFANSLRIRLALRISMAEPLKAKEEFLKAVKHNGGVFELPGECVKVSIRNGYQNPLGEINRVWNEVYMNANMESILNGYNDPRKEFYFEPCVEDITDGGNMILLKGKYKGIRQGTCFAHTMYNSHSKIYVNKETEPILMTSSEVWFLRAEAALRGWSDESVEYAYSQGITTSFKQWGITNVTPYLQSEKIGDDYKDAFDPSNNIAACCKVSPKWIEDASQEVKLEKIITQKWLAIFPEGCEGWAEQRRTGYPRLFPVKINNSKDGCINTRIMIRRLNFPADIIDTEPELYKLLVNALAGQDNAGTSLWWDTGRNF